MFTSTQKSLLLITGLFVCGLLSGQLWHYLGDNNSIINRYLEVHNSRFINTDDSNQMYFVFHNDMQALTDFVSSSDQLIEFKPASMANLATVTIDSSGLPDSLNSLRNQDFIRFIFPGTFPFVCH